MFNVYFKKSSTISFVPGFRAKVAEKSKEKHFPQTSNFTGQSCGMVILLLAEIMTQRARRLAIYDGQTLRHIRGVFMCVFVNEKEKEMKIEREREKDISKEQKRVT